MQPLPTVDEVQGVGDVHFGMRPSQVKELLGHEMTWEEWMNGNVNDALYYPGIILFFDAHRSDGPTADSRLEQIAMRQAFKAQWRGVELSQLTHERVTRLIGADAKARELARGTTEIIAPRLRGYFARSGELIELSIGPWYDA